MKKGVIIKVVKAFTSTMCIVWLWYIAATADYSSLTKNTWDTLTAANWNQLVDNVKWIVTDSSGNVGIGSSSSAANLHVNWWVLTEGLSVMKTTDLSVPISIWNAWGNWNLYNTISTDQSPNAFLIERCPAWWACSRAITVLENGDTGIWTTDPKATLDVNWSIRADSIHFLTKDWVHYNSTPLQCVDVCTAGWWRMATSSEVYAYASAKMSSCGYVWMIDDKNMNKVARWYPMYINRTTSGCGNLNTGNVPRLEWYLDNQSWSSTWKMNCACSWIK